VTSVPTTSLTVMSKVATQATVGAEDINGKKILTVSVMTFSVFNF
jgi:hypothetical protein